MHACMKPQTLDIIYKCVTTHICHQYICYSKCMHSLVYVCIAIGIMLIVICAAHNYTCALLECAHYCAWCPILDHPAMSHAQFISYIFKVIGDNDYL